MTSETRTAVLRRGWYPVARSIDLDNPRQATLLGRRLVAFRTADEPVDVEAGILAAMENFRGVAHFPFVHRGTMGKVPHRVAKFEVHREGYETWMTRTYSAANGESELFRDVEDLTFHYHAVAPGIASVLLDHGAGGKRVVMEAFSPAGPTGCRIFLVSGTAAGYPAYDPAATLATEMQVLHEDLPTLNTLDPLEVPFEREQYELSVEADRYPLATRRAFVEFMRDAGAAVDLDRHPEAARLSRRTADTPRGRRSNLIERVCGATTSGNSGTKGTNVSQ